MKSHDKTFACASYDAVFNDIASCYPHMVKDLRRDFKTICHGIENRGVGFICLDLPDLDACLLAGLESGVLPKSEPHGLQKGTLVPRLFKGLWLLVFDTRACLLGNPDVNAIAFLRQLTCMWKKLEHACSLKRIRNTLNEYEDIEHSTIRPTLQWGSEYDEFGSSLRSNDLSFGVLSSDCNGLLLVPDDKSECGEYNEDYTSHEIRTALKRLDRLSQRVCREVGFFDISLIHNNSGHKESEDPAFLTAFRHGPGAVSDDTPANDKFLFDSWCARLSGVFPYYPCGATSLHRLGDIPRDVDVPSNLLCVPKTLKGPRLIASEPAANMWCQQMLGTFITRKLHKWKAVVNTKDQSVSRQLVLKSSRDRNLATIDLSNASDRLSCFVVERVFGHNHAVLSALNAVRSSHIRQDMKGCRPFLLKSRKYATQGTACTFPIQSIVFALIAMAACGYKSPSEAAGKVRVFGDDIIVPNDKVEKVISLLHFLGLKVNLGKTFSKGYFRESCGMDAYKGYDVTPYKFAQLPSTKPAVQQAYFDYANNLFKGGYWHLSRLAEGRSLLLRRRQLTRDRQDQSNVYSFSAIAQPAALRSRWNKDLQRREFRCSAVINKPKLYVRTETTKLMCNQHSMFGENFSSDTNVVDRQFIVDRWEAEVPLVA